MWKPVKQIHTLYTCIRTHVHDPASLPDNSRSDFSTEEDAERADRMRREHSDDGKRHGKFPVQSVSQH